MALFLPSLALDTTLVPFATIAIAMIGVTIFVFGKMLPSDGQPPLLTHALLALSVLVGGSLLLLSLVFVYLDPNGADAWTWVLMAFNGMMMPPVGIWMIGVILFRERRIGTAGWTWPALLAITTAGSEATMGILFVLAPASSPPSALLTLAGGLTSIWFFWSMSAVMLALLLWAPLSRVERLALLALGASAVVAPWVTAFPTVGGAAMGAIMAVIFLRLLAPLRRLEVRVAEVGVLFGLAVAFLVTAIAGFAVAATGGAAVADLAFGGTMGVVMAVEIAYLFRRFYHGSAYAPWVPRARAAGSRAPVPVSAGAIVAPWDR